MRCLFARGKLNQRELSSPASRGSFLVPVSNASDYFEPGDLVFVSDADGGRTGFLGPAASVSSTEIQCLLALSCSRDPGALVWKPLESLLFPKKRKHPRERCHDTGVSVRRSIGGSLHLTRIREPVRTETLRFEGLRKREVEELLDWMEEVLGGGIERFTFCDESCRVSVSAILSSEILHDEKSPDGVGIEMEIERLEKERYE